MKNIRNWIMPFFFIGLFSLSAHAGVFNIVPQTSLPSTVPQGGSTQAYYTVTNTTGSFHAGNYVKYLPPNVTQVDIDGSIPNLCSRFFSLAAGKSCILELKITGPVNRADPNPRNHLFVCLGGCVTCCAGTNYPLDVKVTQSPTVSATSPINGSTNVTLSTTIAITFSLPMNTSSLMPANFRLYNPNGATYVTLTNPVYSNSNKTVTFNTNTQLNSSTVYQIIIPAPQNIRSAEGVSLSTGGVISTFTTSSTAAAPTVSATNPQNSSTNVPVSTNVVITFSIPMNTNTLIPANFRLYNPGASTYVTLTNPIYSNSNKTVTFNTTSQLIPSTVYQIIIPSPENITSAGGVALSTGGIISSFTTAAAGLLCAQTWVLNAGNNSISACSSDSVSGAIVACSGSNVPVAGASLNNPTAMIWSGLLLSITNANGTNPLVVIDTVSNPSPPFTASATGSNTSNPTGLAALNGFGWIANGDSTLTYCTSAQTGNSWSGCSVATPTNYLATTTSISVISGVLSNPSAAGVLYTANTTTNSISACPITNSITIPTCYDAGGSGFNQPSFVAGRVVTFGSPYYVLITNKGNNTVLRCTFDNQTFMLSNCTSTGSNFN